MTTHFTVWRLVKQDNAPCHQV